MNTPLVKKRAVTAKLLALLSIAFGCLTANAGDERFGFATHFEQGWPYPTLMPAIAATGVSYIRDDLNAWAWEPSAGVYVRPSWDISWLTAAKANGLKVVAILGPNGRYANNYDPGAMSRLAAFIAKTGLVTAFEITNEPNNAYAAYVGSAWQSKLLALTNSVSAAVHAVNPAIQVIGLGAQGVQIFNMLAMGTTINGVAYHPYANGNAIPETTYEWPYLDYGVWITTLKAKTKLPAWETEWGHPTWSAFSETNQANFIARRLLQHSGLGVEHSFIYEFKDNFSELFGVETNAFTPKAAYAVVKRVISTLASVKGGGTGTSVTVNSVANGNLADMKAYAYQGSVNKTVVAFWFGNHDPRTPPPASTCKITFTAPHPHSHSVVMNAMTGTQMSLGTYQNSQAGTQITVSGLPISHNPSIIIVQ